MPGSRQPTHNAPDQPSLFFPALAEQPETREDSLVRLAPLTSGSTLGACALPYAEHLRLTDHSAYTITCFLSDLRLLTEYLGRDRTLSSIVRGDVSGWLTHLKWERGAPPAPKTMARRITFLKNFFGWLASTSLLPTNLAANIALSRPAPPLPELLYDDEVRRLEDAAAADARCHLLVMLLLATGLKKEEVAHLRLQDVDLSDPEHPTVEIHFPGQAKRRRERRMELPSEWMSAFERYIERYQPQEYVFECTDRNLNYVLAAAVKRAHIEKRVTLQLLRDIYAVRQLRAGASMETLRERLGLSEEAWYETAEKYRKLAFPA